jgi:hypothetical protein
MNIMKKVLVAIIIAIICIGTVGGVVALQSLSASTARSGCHIADKLVNVSAEFPGYYNTSSTLLFLGEQYQNCTGIIESVTVNSIQASVQGGLPVYLSSGDNILPAIDIVNGNFVACNSYTIGITDATGAKGSYTGTPPYGNGHSCSSDAVTVSFTYSPSSPSINQLVTFSGSASSSLGYAIASWTWSFGVGSVGSGSSVTHSYTSAGTYVVKLNATDSFSTSGSSSRNVGISGPGKITLDSSGSNSWCYVGVACPSVQTVTVNDSIANDLIVVTVGTNGFACSASSPPSASGVTFTAIGNILTFSGGGNYNTMCWFYGFWSGTGNLTITCPAVSGNNGGAQFDSCTTFSLSHVNQSTPIDTNAGSICTSTNIGSAGTISCTLTTSGSNDTLVGWSFVNQGTNSGWTAASGFTLTGSNTQSCPNGVSCAEYKDSFSAGSQSVSITGNGYISTPNQGLQAVAFVAS